VIANKIYCLLRGEVSTSWTRIAGHPLHLAAYRIYCRAEVWTASAAEDEAGEEALSENGERCRTDPGVRNAEELQGWPQPSIMSSFLQGAEQIAVRSTDFFCCQLYHLVV